MVGPLWPRTIAIAVFEVAGVVLPSTASLEISHYSCMIGWI